MQKPDGWDEATVLAAGPSCLRSNPFQPTSMFRTHFALEEGTHPQQLPKGPGGTSLLLET